MFLRALIVLVLAMAPFAYAGKVVLKEVKKSPAAVQACAGLLGDQLAENGYKVTAITPQANKTYLVSFGPSAAQGAGGRLESASFILNANGTLASVAKAVFVDMPSLRAQALFTLLKEDLDLNSKVPWDVQALVRMAKTTLAAVEEDGTIYFTLNGANYVGSVNAGGHPYLRGSPGINWTSVARNGDQVIYTRQFTFGPVDIVEIIMTVTKNGPATYKVRVVGPNSTVKLGTGKTLTLDFGITGIGDWGWPGAGLEPAGLVLETVAGERMEVNSHQYAFFKMHNANFQHPDYGESMIRTMDVIFNNGRPMAGGISFWTKSPSGISERSFSIHHWSFLGKEEIQSNTIQFWADDGSSLLYDYMPSSEKKYIVYADLDGIYGKEVVRKQNVADETFDDSGLVTNLMGLHITRQTISE